jgi:hypothetical protein
VKELEAQDIPHQDRHDLPPNELAASEARDDATPFQYFLEEEDQGSTSPVQVFAAPPPHDGAHAIGTGMNGWRRSIAANQPLINKTKASKAQLLFGDHGYFSELFEPHHCIG